MFIFKRLFKLPNSEIISTSSTPKEIKKYINMIIQQCSSTQSKIITTSSSDIMKKCYKLIYVAISQNSILIPQIQSDIKFTQKSSPHWNYSNELSVFQSLEFSIKKGVLGKIIGFWCDAMQVYLQTITLNRANNSNTQKYNMLRVFRTEIYTICKIMWKILKKINESFFQQLDARVTSLGLNLKQIQKNYQLNIIQKLRNTLTTVKRFGQISRVLYNIMSFQDYSFLIMENKINKKMKTIKQILNEKYKFNNKQISPDIFNESVKKLLKFHKQVNLKQKFMLLWEYKCQIGTDIQNAGGITISQQPIYRDICIYLSQKYCPEIWKSVIYILTLVAFNNETIESDSLRRMEKQVGESIVEQFKILQQITSEMLSTIYKSD